MHLLGLIGVAAAEASLYDTVVSLSARFDALAAENVALRQRMATLESIVVGSDRGDTTSSERGDIVRATVDAAAAAPGRRLTSTSPTCCR